MKRATIASAGLGLAIGLLSACGSGASETVTWTGTIKAEVEKSCGTAMVACHGSNAANTFKYTAGMDMANYLSAKAHTNASAPAMSKFCAYPGNAMHGGGVVNGYATETATGRANCIKWVMGGALFQ